MRMKAMMFIGISAAFLIYYLIIGVIAFGIYLIQIA